MAMVMHQAIPYTAQIREGWDAFCAEHPDDLTCDYAVPDKVDPERQIAFFEDYISKGAQGIVTNCVPADVWTEPVKAAREAGVLVNSVDCTCLTESGWNVQVGPDFYSQGKQFAKEFFDALAEKGKTSGQVVIGYCAPGYPSQEARMKAMVEECQARGTYDCVGNLDTGHNVDLNYGFWETATLQYDQAVAFVGTCAFDGPNLLKLKALREATWEIGTWDLEPETLEGLKSGQLLAAVGNNPFLNAYLAGRLLYEHLKSGEPLYVAGLVDTPSEIVTYKNAAEYFAREADPAAKAAYYKGIADSTYVDLDAAIIKSPY
jgi:ribose transport system substrate-binding protein